MHVKLRDIDDCWGLIGDIVYNKRFNDFDNLDQYSAYLYVARKTTHATQHKISETADFYSVSAVVSLAVKYSRSPTICINQHES
jgi:hypothetical protein